jgi:hypothetical protein
MSCARFRRVNGQWRVFCPNEVGADVGDHVAVERSDGRTVFVRLMKHYLYASGGELFNFEVYDDEVEALGFDGAKWNP